VRTGTTDAPKTAPRLARRDPPGSTLVLLEAGLCALVLYAPLPFGCVGPKGRLALELLALALTVVWSLAALRREVALPPRAVCVALIALLGLAAVQIVPLGGAGVAAISPKASALRAGLDPVPIATLSLAPAASASALRTGAALAGIVFVATSVVAAAGARRLALAALIAAAFQGLYGLLVVASGHDRIWSMPKTAYLDSATGTFVNRNHFAAFLAATLPLGIGLIVALAKRAAGHSGRRRGLAAVFGAEASRAWLYGLLALTGFAGLLVSLSRAGTALGVAACIGTAAVALRKRPVPLTAVIAIVVAVAAIPLLDLSAERLVTRYAETGGELRVAGGRLSVAADTLRMIAAFPVSGCGFGTFNAVYPAFSSPEVRLHYTHAHNDLLQLAAEGGLPALSLLTIVLVFVAGAAVRAVRREGDPVALGAAFGLAALLVHGLVDFNFHIPANAALAALLAGLLFGARWNDPS
jgi:putative inorganic carbon (HCO3(-)) transporter